MCIMWWGTTDDHFFPRLILPTSHAHTPKCHSHHHYKHRVHFYFTRGYGILHLICHAVSPLTLPALSHSQKNLDARDLGRCCATTPRTSNFCR